MKKILTLSIILLLSIALFHLSSCKKSNPAPDYPALIGSWGGTTSQDGPITFYIDNINGTLYVMNYSIKVFTNSGYQVLSYSNTNGIAPVTSKFFHIYLGAGSAGTAFIDGTFDLTSMTLNGSFAVYDNGNNVDITNGTFTAYNK